eukprot:COSAG01_NODE_7311_length_3257_cov_2.390754_5_plen_306_part_00
MSCAAAQQCARAYGGGGTTSAANTVVRCWQVCIVTGASSGLGDRFTRVLHANGAHVVACARRIERLERLARECGGGDNGVTVVQCDVTVEADRQALVRRALQITGRLDVLVNNAGISIEDGQPATSITQSTFLQMMDVNVNAVFFLTQAVATVMLAQKQPDPSRRGVVVNISSIHGFHASAPNFQVAYATSKAAVNNMTRELAVQWAIRGVRVNGLAPGYFPSEIHQSQAMPEAMKVGGGTGATANVLDPEGKKNPYSQHILNSISMRRLGGAHELDGALLYLASDASSYVTGQTMVVDGGWTHK